MNRKISRLLRIIHSIIGRDMEQIKVQGDRQVKDPKIVELQKMKTWDSVYKDLKVRVTMESVHGEKTEVSEVACTIMVKAIKDMLKKEFGERWGHYISSTHRFTVR